jgi:TPR repeat protein
MLADIYNVGDGVSKDEAKSRHYYELAAMAGEVHSRFNLGCIKYNAGNFDRAVKHWLIGASFGDIRAVNHIEKAMINGNATEDQYTQALRCYEQYLDEVRSERRDRAAAYSPEFKYLIESTD